MYLLNVEYEIDNFEKEVYKEKVISEYSIMLEDYLNKLKTVKNAKIIYFSIIKLEYHRCYVISSENIN